jgi:hypothetical protein
MQICIFAYLHIEKESPAFAGLSFSQNMRSTTFTKIYAMKILFYGFAILCLVLSSCNWAKDKTKKTLNKGGEIVGKAGSEVAEGISKGVEETFTISIEKSKRLDSSGIKLGRVSISGTDSSTDNVVSVYLIFDQKYTGIIMAKAIGQDGLEFGRTSVNISADLNEARFVDFIFDRRTNLDRNDHLILE